MLDPKKCHRAIDDLAKKLAGAMPGSVKQAKDDMEKTFHSILQSAFAKLDLVTREEFDVQAAVLAKTRAKLEKLEQSITVLEVKAGIKNEANTDERDND